jgi:hypothetical protein
MRPSLQAIQNLIGKRLCGLFYYHFDGSSTKHATGSRKNLLAWRGIKSVVMPVRRQRHLVAQL